MQISGRRYKLHIIDYFPVVRCQEVDLGGSNTVKKMLKDYLQNILYWSMWPGISLATLRVHYLTRRACEDNDGDLVNHRPIETHTSSLSRYVFLCLWLPCRVCEVSWLHVKWDVTSWGSRSLIRYRKMDEIVLFGVSCWAHRCVHVEKLFTQAYIIRYFPSQLENFDSDQG